MPEESKQKRARRVLVCATGAYVSYSLPWFILQLLRHVADDVQVILSRAAAKMVSPYSVEVASRNRVFVEMDDHSNHVFVPHIELSRSADFIVVYPASVNVMGKVANGIADELIPALILAAEIPVLFVPVSNRSMIDHPAVRRNVEQLKADGYVVLEPLPGPEVATREGLDGMRAPFPIPTLLLQMNAVLSDTSSRGHAKRSPI
jgi:phosphopantothenoylcysteine synthetase/decarboxylase